MIGDVKDALVRHALGLNLEKCNIQTKSGSSATYLVVDGVAVPIVSPSEGFKILGARFMLSRRSSADITGRINAAWGKFHKILPLSGSCKGRMTERLRLFDICVGQTKLWCCESYTLTHAEKWRFRIV